MPKRTTHLEVVVLSGIGQYMDNLMITAITGIYF